MHDPMVVAFEIRRPWPKKSSPISKNPSRWQVTIHRKYGQDHKGWNPRRWWRLGAWSPFMRAFGRTYYFPSVVTVWHVEPEGRDSGEVCKHHCRWQDQNGEWRSKSKSGWKYHFWHWHIQVRPLQDLRRKLLQRCEWCKGKSVKGFVVNHTYQWDAPKTKWWRSDPGVYHSDCMTAKEVLRSCRCDVPVVEKWNGVFGECGICEKSYRGQARWLTHRRAVEIQGEPVQGEVWRWPKEVRFQDVEKELAQESHE